MRCMTGRTLTLWTESSDTIESLQRQIESRVGKVPWDTLRLIFGGKHLDSRSRVSDYHIRACSTIDVVFRFPGGLGLRLTLPAVLAIATADGKMLAVTTDLMASVYELKLLVSEKRSQLGLPPRPRGGDLVFEGKVLEDEHTLVHYDIEEGSTLHLA